MLKSEALISKSWIYLYRGFDSRCPSSGVSERSSVCPLSDGTLIGSIDWKHLGSDQISSGGLEAQVGVEVLSRSLWFGNLVVVFLATRGSRHTGCDGAQR